MEQGDCNNTLFYRRDSRKDKVRIVLKFLKSTCASLRLSIDPSSMYFTLESKNDIGVFSVVGMVSQGKAVVPRLSRMKAGRSGWTAPNERVFCWELRKDIRNDDTFAGAGSESSSEDKVILHTTLGDITLKIFSDRTPKVSFPPIDMSVSSAANTV